MLKSSFVLCFHSPFVVFFQSKILSNCVKRVCRPWKAVCAVWPSISSQAAEQTAKDQQLQRTKIYIYLCDSLCTTVMISTGHLALTARICITVMRCTLAWLLFHVRTNPPLIRGDKSLVSLLTFCWHFVWRVLSDTVIDMISRKLLSQHLFLINPWVLKRHSHLCAGHTVCHEKSRFFQFIQFQRIKWTLVVLLLWSAFRVIEKVSMSKLTSLACRMSQQPRHAKACMPFLHSLLTYSSKIHTWLSLHIKARTKRKNTSASIACMCVGIRTNKRPWT